MDKYLLTATVRQDGSTRFGAGHKWGLFPSFSAAWRVSEEPFLQGLQVLSDLKLRAGFGITGSQEIGNLRSLPTLAPDQGFIWIVGEDETEITGVAPNNFANEDLKWEETTTINVGLDYGFSNGKFSGAVDFYVKDTDDLLIEFDVPQPAVVGTRLENVGSVRNTGVEFSLNALAVDRRDLSVTLSAVVSSNKNEVIDLGGREQIITGTVSGAGLSGVSAQIIQEGEPLGTFYGPVFLGIENGEQQFLLDDSGNRVRQIIGNAQPNLSYGLHTNVLYKSWDLGFFIRGEQGRDVFNNSALEYTAKFLANTNVNFFQEAVDDGTSIENGIAVFSSRWIEDASFLRLDNVTLGYTFMNNLPGIAGEYVRRARVYLAAQNLLVLTSYDGYDPEVNTDAEENGVPSLGIDYANYPRPRMFTVGVSLGF
jgi:iron complex outermembrane receptor protein